MTPSTYSASVPGFGEVLRFTADLADATAPLRILVNDGVTLATPYRTADASHCPECAARLLGKWLESEKGEPYIHASNPITITLHPEIDHDEE